MRCGAISVTRTQENDARPLAKKATHMMAIIAAFEVTWLAATMTPARARPVTIGVLRAKDADMPRLTIQSDQLPPHSTPTRAATKGRAPVRPPLSRLRPRSSVRYVGNQVRKK